MKNKNQNPSSSSRKKYFSKNKSKDKKHFSNPTHSKDNPKKRFTNKISHHFSKKDFQCSSTQCSCGKKIRISLGLVGGLELLRSKAKNRINIIKGYECQESAEKAGSYKRNLHVKGIAADIRILNTSLKESLAFIEEIKEFKGIGINIKENYIHIDTRKEENRLMWLEEDSVITEITEDNKETILNRLVK